MGRLAVVVAGMSISVAVAGCGSRGARGPVGPIAQAPQLDALSSTSISHDMVVTATGARFTPLVLGSDAELAVIANGVKADVVAASDSSLTFTHAVPASPAVAGMGVSVVVRVNGLTSNPLTATALPSGFQQLDPPDYGGGGGLTVAPNGDLIDLTGAILRINAHGDVLSATAIPEVSYQPRKAWDDGAGGYFLLENDGYLDHLAASGATTRVASIAGATDGDWDAGSPPSFYALVNSAGFADIERWDGATGQTVFPWARLGGFFSNAVTRMGSSLYATDLSDGSIVAVDLPTQAVTPYAANGSVNGPQWLANDGTNLYFFSNGIGRVAPNGAVTQWSTLTPGFQAGSLAAAPGVVYASTVTHPFAPAFVARWSAGGSVIEPWETQTAGSAFGILDGRIFDGSTIPAGDLGSGVLYEHLPDGTIRRVTGLLNNHDRASEEFDGDAGFLRTSAGKLWAVDGESGSITSIDPDSGAVTVFHDNVASPTLSTPSAVDFDADGNGYVATMDTAGLWTVAKLDAGGAVVDLHWGVPPFPQNPITAMAVQGTRVVGFSNSGSGGPADPLNELWTIPLATGGPGGFLQPAGAGPVWLGVNGGMFTDADGDVEMVAFQTGSAARNYRVNPGRLLRLTPDDEFLPEFEPVGGLSAQFGMLDASGVFVGSYSLQHEKVFP